MRTRPAFIYLFASFLLPSCSLFHQQTAEEKANGARRLSAKTHTEYRATPDWRKQIYRDPVGMTRLDPGTSNIRISLAEQRGILFAGNQVAIDFPVSTGKEGHRTPTGKFHVMEKDIDHKSNLYGTRVSGGKVIDNDASSRKSSPEGEFVGAPMPYFMRLTGTGVGMHVGFVPDYPASHGCIRVPRKVMPEIYMNSKVGTPVVIQQESLVSANGPQSVAGASGPTRKEGASAAAAATAPAPVERRGPFSFFKRRTPAPAPAAAPASTSAKPKAKVEVKSTPKVKVAQPEVKEIKAESKPAAAPTTAPAVQPAAAPASASPAATAN